jgi:Flp pilus assembly protein TadB
MLEILEPMIDWALRSLQEWPLWGKILAIAALLTPVVTITANGRVLYDATIGKRKRRRQEGMQRAEQKRNEEKLQKELAEHRRAQEEMKEQQQRTHALVEQLCAHCGGTGRSDGRVCPTCAGSGRG